MLGKFFSMSLGTDKLEEMEEMKCADIYTGEDSYSLSVTAQVMYKISMTEWSVMGCVCTCICVCMYVYVCVCVHVK